MKRASSLKCSSDVSKEKKKKKKETWAKEITAWRIIVSITINFYCERRRSPPTIPREVAVVFAWNCEPYLFPGFREIVIVREQRERGYSRDTSCPKKQAPGNHPSNCRSENNLVAEVASSNHPIFVTGQAGLRVQSFSSAPFPADVKNTSFLRGVGSAKLTTLMIAAAGPARNRVRKIITRLDVPWILSWRGFAAALCIRVD